MEDEFVFDMVDHAEAYANEGFSVIPLNPRAKTPAIATWRGAQSVRPDVETIRKWWTKYPNHNIGLVCGSVSGVVVVDCDGQAAIDAYEERFTHLLNTFTVNTGSGHGRHFYYRTNRTIKSTRYLGTHGNCEIQAEGKYVVAAPSVHPSGGSYEAMATLSSMMQANLEDVIEWIGVLTAKKNSAAAGRSVPLNPPRVAVSCSEAYWKSALRGELDKVYASPEGGQNDALYKAALKIGSMVAGRFLNLNQAQADLMGTARACGYVTRDGERAAWSTIMSGLNTGLRSARDAKKA